MSVSSSDSYLIDTQTGIILSTNTYTKDAFTEKTAQDFDLYQTLERARAESEKKIYNILATDTIYSIDSIQ